MIVDMTSVAKLPVVLKLYDMYGDMTSDKEFYKLLKKCIEEIEMEKGNSISDLSIFESLLKVKFSKYLEENFGKNNTYPSDRELKVLMERIGNGDMDARKEMAERNIGLVIIFAKRYFGISKTLEFEELVDEGCLGLMRAIDKFDITLGYKFSTYASYWILQYLRRAICNADRVVRLPIRVAEDMKRYNRVYSQLMLKLGRTPSDEEMAIGLGMDVTKVRDLFAIRYKYDNMVSLNQKVDNLDDDFSNSDIELLEFIVDERVNLEEDVLNGTLSCLLAQSLELLKDTERETLELRLGLSGDNPMTLNAVAQRCGITHEGVRKREAKALSKLRCPSCSKILRDYY